MTPPAASVLSPRDLGLYALTVVAWSQSWIAMTFQLGEVPVIVSVAYRFGLAAVFMVAWAVLTRRRMRFPLVLHARFALMGALMFSTNFALFMFAAQWITSGLLAVVFSLVTVLNPINAALFLRERLEGRVLVGAAIGVAGIVLIFWPEVSRAEAGGRVLTGLVLAVAGATCFSLGNIVATTVQRLGQPLVSSNAWGMVYGASLLAVVALVSGQPFTFDPRLPYVLSLASLALLATVVAFASYLTLMRSIGPARAGYATVMFPVGALMISWAFEGYVWTPSAVVGVALALAGNLVVLRRSAPAVHSAASS